MALIAAQPLTFAPGSNFRYSNSDYFLLGVIIERVTGESYASYVARHLAARARLRATSYCPEAGPRIAGARGSVYVNGSYQPAPFVDPANAFAAGGLCSTADDLQRWSDALAEGRVVSARSYRQMTQQTRVNNQLVPYGFGLEVQDSPAATIGHLGVINGFESEVTRYPTRRLLVIVLTNTTDLTGNAIRGLVDTLQRIVA